MRFASTVVLALPALALAQDQVPLVDQLKGYWNKLTDAVTSAVPAAPSSPVKAAAAKVAAVQQHELTLDNWKRVLTVDPTASTPSTQDWLIYVSGGNVSCFGFCGNASAAWNQSVALISAKPNPPKLAILDCESEHILCGSWSVAPPSLAYFNIPKPLADQSAPSPTTRFTPLNRTASVEETVKLIVVDKIYEQEAPYEGVFHPFTGTLQQYGLAVPVAYAIWGFGKLPPWLPMILISFLSRSFMGRRLPQDRPNAQAGGAAARPAQ